jgi:5S rRNA maturation endonuclease (ribonuclease M5)
VLKINKENGRFVDFARNITGSFEDLIKLSLNLSSTEEAKKYISENSQAQRGEQTRYIKPKIKEARILSQDFLKNIKKDNSYWNSRGVSDETLELLEGGVCESGRMKNRYVFPVFNSQRKLVGVSGRYIYDIKEGAKTVKWKHLGDKYSWSYPLQTNIKILKNLKKVILVESIGDMLSLFDASIKNVIVLFGVKMSTAILNTLLRLDAEEVIIALNDDGDKSKAGNLASKQVRSKLLKFFDTHQIKVAFPTKNDFGEMSKEEIHEWAAVHLK